MRRQDRAANFEKEEFFAQPKTREELYKLRREFWETRTTNSRSVWLELKRAQDVAFDGDPATAAMLLQAMECAQWKDDPTHLYRYTFDSQGRQYNVPMYIFKDPDNLLDDLEEDISADADDFVSFKVRPSNYGEDISFERPLSTKINELKIDVYKHLKLDSTTDRLRFFYQGKRMEEIHTLGKPKRVKKDMVITAFISKNVTE